MASFLGLAPSMNTTKGRRIRGVTLLDLTVAFGLLGVVLPALVGAIVSMTACGKGDAAASMVRNLGGEVMAAIAGDPRGIRKTLPATGAEEVLDLAGVLRLLSVKGAERELPADVREALEKCDLSVRIAASDRPLDLTSWVVKVSWTSGGRRISRTFCRLTAKE